MTCTAPLREEEFTETVYVSVLLQSPVCYYHTVLQVQVGILPRIAVGHLLYRHKDSGSDALLPALTGLIAVAMTVLVVIVVLVAIFMCSRLKKKKTKEEKQGR